jgi:hypothetical protein
VKPNFLVIGAARSGTTALCKQLGQHPDIFMTEPKEMHFFAHANAEARYTGPGDSEMINRHVVSDPSAYLDLYNGSTGATARGEGSVSTLYAHNSAPDAIDRWADPDVRLVAVLREPADRAYSSYLYLRARGYEPLSSFEQALEHEPERRSQGFHHMWHYSEMSRYEAQLPVFAERFGDRLLTLVFEEYRDDPLGHLAQICSHLRVDETFDFSTGGSINSGGEQRSKLLSGAMAGLRSNEGVKRFVKKVVPSTARERVRQLNLAKPELEPSVLPDLYADHAGDREAVQAVLGREVPSWRR